MVKRSRVLILDGAIYPDLYRPTQHWRVLVGDADVDSVHLPSGATVPDLAGYSHVIVTGSEASITVKEAWFETEAAAVREAAQSGLPILASCFGHQMLAYALSHPRFARRSATPELGWIPVETVAPDPLLDGLPRTWYTFALHFDEVADPPAPWRVLARSAGAAVQVMRFGDAPVWGIQAHPEIEPTDGRLLLEGLMAKVPRWADRIRPALAEEPRDDGCAAEIVRRFLTFSRPTV